MRAVRKALTILAIAVLVPACDRNDGSRHAGRQYVGQVDSLRILVDSLRQSSERNRHPIDAVDLAFLRYRGIHDPIGRLVKGLQTRSDLIPFQNPLPESQFGFYFEKGIVVLDRSHVFAHVEDGHGQGGVLLEYEFADTTINWKVLWGSRYE